VIDGVGVPAAPGAEHAGRARGSGRGVCATVGWSHCW
jgi:hypothetical protein